MRRTKSKYSHLTYSSCKAILEEAQNRGTSRVKLAPNTYLSRNGDEYVIYFHAEPILTFLPGGGVRYDRGGGRTTETLQRMNQFAPGNHPLIREVGGTWIGPQELPFEDGMILGWDTLENALVKGRDYEDMATLAVLRDYRLERGYISEPLAS